VQRDARRNADDVGGQPDSRDPARDHADGLPWRHPDPLGYAEIVYPIPGVQSHDFEHPEPSDHGYNGVSVLLRAMSVKQNGSLALRLTWEVARVRRRERTSTTAGWCPAARPTSY